MSGTPPGRDHNAPHPAVAVYKSTVDSGTPLSWKMVNDLDAAGFGTLADEALHALARGGNLRARLQLLARPFGNLLGWFSPGAWVTWRIQKGRLPGTVFDVGPGGIPGWHSQMQKERKQFVTLVLAALSAYYIMHPAIVLLWYWTREYFHHYGLVERGAFGFWLLLPLAAGWHWDVGRAYAREWKALEAHGLRWHFENGSWFRMTFQRLDGSFEIDRWTRQQRLEGEKNSVRDRSQAIAKNLRKAAVTLLVAAGIYYGVGHLCLYFELSLLVFSNAPVVLALLYVWINLPEPLAELAALFGEGRHYAKGYQFIPFPRVTDPLHDRVTLESVRHQAALGDGAFVRPREASQKLRS